VTFCPWSRRTTPLRARPIRGIFGIPLSSPSAAVAPRAAACRFRNLDSSVPMMYPAKDRKRNNVSEPLDRACARRVLPERNVRSHLVIIGGIFRKDSSKVLRVEHDQMISALASRSSVQHIRSAKASGTKLACPVPSRMAGTRPRGLMARNSGVLSSPLDASSLRREYPSLPR
jgi:hypothetical protein